MEGYLVQGDSANDQCGTLRTAVSAGVHQHGDEGYKKRDRSESVFITGDDGSGDNRRKHQHQKPWDSAFCVFPGGYFKVSFFTVKKAYDNLEAEGMTVTVHGKGTYVAASNIQLMEEERRKEVEADLEAVIQKGRRCGMKGEEIRSLFELIMEDE